MLMPIICHPGISCTCARMTDRISFNYAVRACPGIQINVFSMLRSSCSSVCLDWKYFIRTKCVAASGCGASDFMLSTMYAIIRSFR